MSDANITVDVDTSQIDALITNLDTALGRRAVVGGQGMGRSLDPSGKLTNAQLRLLSKQVAIASFGGYPNGVAVNTKNWRELDKIWNNPTQWKNLKDAAEPIGGVRGAIRGLTFSREERILANRLGIPMREIYNLKRGEKGLSAGYSYIGIITAIATAVLLIDQVNRIRRSLKAEDEEYRKQFLEYKPDLTRDEFQQIKDRSTDNWGKFVNYIFRSS